MFANISRDEKGSNYSHDARARSSQINRSKALLKQIFEWSLQYARTNYNRLAISYYYIRICCCYDFYMLGKYKISLKVQLEEMKLQYDNENRPYISRN